MPFEKFHDFFQMFHVWGTPTPCFPLSCSQKDTSDNKYLWNVLRYIFTHKLQWPIVWPVNQHNKKNTKMWTFSISDWHLKYVLYMDFDLHNIFSRNSRTTYNNCETVQIIYNRHVSSKREVFFYSSDLLKCHYQFFFQRKTT